MADRALSSGIPIPQWMRGGTNGGFDPSTLSPPTYDDDFFQINISKSRLKTDCAPINEQSSRLQNRPHGVDDGFHGPKSACAIKVVTAAERVLRQRRNSKSLPASPLGSPETRRRLANRFFTLETPPREPSGSTSNILDALARADPNFQVSSQPQASELREMNFLSPTSM